MKRFTTLLVLVSLFLVSTSFKSSVDVTKLIKETQQTRNADGKLTIAWWIPVEFWEDSFRNSDRLTEKQSAEFIATLRPYLLLAVMDGSMKPLGSIDYVSYDSIYNSLSFVDQSGNTHKPLTSDEIDSEVNSLLTIMKPMLKNVMGSLGENFNFYVFKDIDKKNNRIADPLRKGEFSFSFCEKTFSWSTPLSALTPPKRCPVDQKEMDGTWTFCPYHGEKLVEK